MFLVLFLDYLSYTFLYDINQYIFLFLIYRYFLHQVYKLKWFIEK